MSEMDQAFIETLICPACSATLELKKNEDEDRLHCTSKECGRSYPIREGVAFLIASEAQTDAANNST